MEKGKHRQNRASAGKMKFPFGHSLAQRIRGQRTAGEGRRDGDGDDKNAKAFEAGVIHRASAGVLGQDSVRI